MLYKRRQISERHRHRYEVNEKYVEQYALHGFCVSGRHPDTYLIEMMELHRDIHPFYIGTQAHPEFRSRLGAPNPLFDGLIASAMEFSKKGDT
jgi:CTP synthase